MTPEQRKAVSEGMRRYWQERHEQEARERETIESACIRRGAKVRMSEIRDECRALADLLKSTR